MHELIRGDYISGIYWSPDGSRIAFNLTADDRSGVIVIDLKTGVQTRVADYERMVHGWSPDGRWLIAVHSRWQDQTYAVNLTDLLLIAADGSETRILTTDGRSSYPIFQPPAAAAAASPALTFDWGKRVFTREDLKRAASKPPALWVAHWAEFLADPEVGPPFTVRIGLKSGAPVGEQTLSTILVEDCEDIPDAVERLEQAFTHENLDIADDFALIYPRFAVEDPDLEPTLLMISGLIYDEAVKRDWQFKRELPKPR